MTNNQIVIWIVKNVDVDKFIERVISTSSLEQNGDDLKQYIYLYLLTYDNEKLNSLYDNKVIPQFIMQMILNQRNYYKSYYNEYLKNNDCDYDYDVQEEELEYDDRNEKLNFINKELTKYVGKRKNLTKQQEYEMLCYEIYRMIIKRNMSIKQLSENLDINYRTVLRLLKFAKDNIKMKYYKK